MTGEIASEELKLALKDICEHCGLPESKIMAYIEEGVVEIRGGDVEQWRFSEVNMVQFRKAYRLETDLRLNPAGAALALELMAQIERLEQKLKRLERAARNEDR